MVLLPHSVRRSIPLTDSRRPAPILVPILVPIFVEVIFVLILVLIFVEVISVLVFVSISVGPGAGRLRSGRRSGQRSDKDQDKDRDGDQQEGDAPNGVAAACRPVGKTVIAAVAATYTELNVVTDRLRNSCRSQETMKLGGSSVRAAA
jgi:hypothetical protein